VSNANPAEPDAGASERQDRVFERERAGAEDSAGLVIGVLASQGDFAAHARVLRSLGAEPLEVRTPEELEQIDGLVIPGGESTTITKAIERDGLEPAVRSHVERGRPLLGTCAGLIVCDRDHLGLTDTQARRNAFGRQLHSFETDLRVAGLGDEPLRAVFIRAPWIDDHGPAVEVLAELDGHPVVARQGPVLVCAFHPELTDDSRLHALFMAMVSAARQRAAGSEQWAGGEAPR
jgi:5'-phosphate synthase pdxT subunit